ncbi:MAG TPA: glycosyltransferase [Solirubrobacterales bacterium]|nr:glycosyltransferase [Solirubrobacterales bacterium]
MGAGSLSIAQVSPHPWGKRHEINEFVARTSAELAERGHRVLIIAPSDSRQAIRESRRLIREAQDDPRAVWKGDNPRVIAIGQSIPLPSGPRRRPAPLPVDVSGALERLLGSVSLDVVHVHEPFAPSTGSAALRHSMSLNVATFHEPVERVLSTQVARMVVEVFFGRIDARTASNEATGELLQRFFPGRYELIRPGADVARPALEPPPAGRVRIAYCAEEERGALRLLLRALRKLPKDLDWEGVIWFDGPTDPLARVSRRLREHLRVVRPRDGEPAEFLAGADIACLTSGGVRAAPGLLRKAFAAGAVPVTSDLELYRELVGEGERGLLFPLGDVLTLTAQLERLCRDPALREELRTAARSSDEARRWTVVSDDVEAVYRRLVAQRHDEEGNEVIRRRLRDRSFIDCDLHMHTDHSPDCATPAEVLLETAKEQGLGAIAITDHNEISGALEAREIAARIGGIKVILAEEVKTAHEGEVIGLFLSERIERGMSMAETIAEIRRQGGLVYVPHPFDRLHSVPDYENLLEIVEDIDILEVFNPRVTLSAFNEEAVKFARKYRIVPGAGSDSHVAQGLGSVKIRLRDFEGAQEFLESMREADIVRKHKNLVYVQALKFLQTSGGRGGRSLAARDGGRGARNRRRSASKS